MHAAIHAATPDDVIIGVRGGRVYQANPTTGAILSRLDYQQLGLGGACVSWDLATNKCFASAWNGRCVPTRPAECHRAIAARQPLGLPSLSHTDGVARTHATYSMRRRRCSARIETVLCIRADDVLRRRATDGWLV